MPAPQTISEYIDAQPPNFKDLLEKAREVISTAAPEATEAMAYGIPTFRLNGNLVHFGLFKNHLGFYPAPSGIVAFKDQLKPYKSAKGSVQFPVDQPIPWDLIAEITRFRVAENTKTAG